MNPLENITIPAWLLYHFEKTDTAYSEEVNLNIGLQVLWVAKHYGFHHAVEQHDPFYFFRLLHKQRYGRAKYAYQFHSHVWPSSTEKAALQTGASGLRLSQ